MILKSNTFCLEYKWLFLNTKNLFDPQTCEQQCLKMSHYYVQILHSCAFNLIANI